MGRGDSKPSSRDQSEEVSSSEHSDDEDAPKVSERGRHFSTLFVTLHDYLSTLGGAMKLKLAPFCSF